MAFGIDDLSWGDVGSMAQGLGSIGGGIMQYKIGKDTLDFQKNQFNTQYNDFLNQRKKNNDAVQSAFGLGTYSAPMV
jgi:hypothetical protein